MNIPKALRWLRSRPLARARRTLAIRKRAANLPAFALSPEVRAFYRRELLDNARQEERVMAWARADLADELAWYRRMYPQPSEKVTHEG